MRQHLLRTFATPILAIGLFASLLTAVPAFAENPRVQIDTNYGAMEVELLPKLAPRTVENFLGLVDEEFYDGLIFHRVIANFMIQGGGFTPDLKRIPDRQTVINESFNGLKNTKGTLAMARLTDPDSADTQFFINVKDNPHLDAGAGRAGYTVFARIVAGQDTVTTIELVNTHFAGGMAAVPEEPVIIEKIRRL